MNPIFSIIIPTLNRPEFAKTAVDSILNQKFDFCVEVILSNNGGDKRTSEIFNSELYKSKIKYIETEKVLSMPKHWEWASLQATGDYLMVLPDRRILKQGALSTIRDVIIDFPQCESVIFTDEWLYDSGLLVTMKSLNNDIFVTTKRVLIDFENGVFDRNMLPLALNSAIKNEFIQNYRLQHGCYFQSISPDFRSAFNYLFSAEFIYSIADPIMVTTGFKSSNGGAAYAGDNTYLTSLKEEGLFKFMPRCFEGNVWASIFEDYLRTKSNFFDSVSYNDIMTLDAMQRINNEELFKLINSRFKKQSRLRYFKIRRVLKSYGWRLEYDIKTINYKSFFILMIPASIKKVLSSTYLFFFGRKDKLKAAGF